MDLWSFHINQREWIKKGRGSKKREWEKKVKTMRVWEKNTVKKKKEVERKKRVMERKKRGRERDNRKERRRE